MVVDSTMAQANTLSTVITAMSDVTAAARDRAARVMMVVAITTTTAAITDLVRRIQIERFQLGS